MADVDDTNVRDEEILTVFAETDREWLRPTDAAEDLPLEVERLRDRFEELGEEGLLERDPDRRSGTAYHLTPDGADAAAGTESTVTDVEAQATGTGTAATTVDQEHPESPPPEPGESVAGEPYELPDDAIEAFDPPGTPEQTEARRRALRRAYAYLRERGQASRSEFVTDVYPGAQGAYEAPDAGWWAEVIRPGLASLPGVEGSDDGEEWRFTGEGESPPP